MAAKLLVALAPKALANDWLRLALDPDQEDYIRVEAICAFGATGAPIPHAALARLLDEQFDERPFSSLTASATLSGNARSGNALTADVLRLVQTHDQAALAIQRLERIDRAGRARLLWQNLTSQLKCLPILADWLRTRWLLDVGDGPLDELDYGIACCGFAKRDPVFENMVLEHWLSVGPRGEAFYAYLELFPRLRSALVDPADRGAALDALALPASEVVELLGLGRLRRTLKEAVLAMSFARRCPVVRAEDRDGRIPGRYARALDVLETLGTTGAEMAGSFLVQAALDEDVQRRLFRLIFACSPTHLRDALAAKVELPQVLGAVIEVLDRVAHPSWLPTSPMVLRLGPSWEDAASRKLDRSLQVRAARAALDHPSEAVQYLGLELLDAIGEDLANEELAVLLGGAELVRVRVLAALARRADGDAESALEQMAVRSERVEVRAEAIRLLGGLDGAGRHFQLFERAMLTDRARFNDEATEPAAEQAALAIACLGGEAAFELLWRQAFATGSDGLWRVEQASLRVLASELEGTPLSARERRLRIEEGSGWVSSWSPIRYPESCG